MTSTIGSLHYKNWNDSYIPNILKEIYLDKIYQPYLNNIQDKVVLDLGLNIGLWSIYAAPFAKHVYAFEPAKETYDLAVRNLKDNGITNATLYQKAVADSDGELTLYHNTNSTMNSLNVMVNDNSQASETVPTIRLDTFVAQEKLDRIGFAKIDVEGSEAVLFASESFKTIAPIVDAFVYEWHSWTNVSPHVINAGLMDLGYVVKQIPSDAVIFGAVRK